MDRNLIPLLHRKIWKPSLSARRAWIEIIDYIIDYVNDAVALRKESVDRNYPLKTLVILSKKSLSARRAWIEIPAGCWRDARRACRSPQGERG